MRDIEFRAKTTHNKGLNRKNDWIIGDLVHNTLTISICIPSPSQAGARRFYKVDPNTIGQYVGLKDNSEQKVYEGDILYDPNDTDNGFYVVEFMDGEFVLINDNIICNIEQVHFLRIVGNIHDNKELLANEDNKNG